MRTLPGIGRLLRVRQLPFHRLPMAALAAPVLGLSIDHISPHAVLKVAPRGQLCEVTRHGYRSQRPSHSQRGAVSGFSRRSRSRLLKLCASLDADRARAGLFVTLTYPSTWPSDAPDWKTHLDSFGKRLSRRCANVSAVWKLEFQKRGAPHFHLLVLGVPYIAASWLASAWYEIVKSGQPEHLVAGTQVDRVRRARSVIAYAAKYLGKVQTTNTGDCVGRYWGIVGRKQLPIHTVEQRLTRRAGCAVVRVLRKVYARSATARRHSRYRASWRIIDGRLAERIARWAGTLDEATRPLTSSV